MHRTPKPTNQSVRKDKRLGLPNQRAADKAKRGRAATAGCALDDDDDGLDDSLSDDDFSDLEYDELDEDAAQYVVGGDPAREHPSPSVLQRDIAAAATWKRQKVAKPLKRRPASNKNATRRGASFVDETIAAQLALRGFTVANGGVNITTAEQLLANIEAVPLEDLVKDDDNGMGSRVPSSVLFQQLFAQPPSSDDPSSSSHLRRCIGTSFIDRMPYDCWGVVAGFLNPHGLLCLATSCAHMRTLLEECTEAWLAAWGSIFVFPKLDCYKLDTATTTEKRSAWLQFETTKFVQLGLLPPEEPVLISWVITKKIVLSNVRPILSNQLLFPSPENLKRMVPTSRKFPWSFYWSLRHFMASEALAVQFTKQLSPLNVTHYHQFDDSRREMLKAIIADLLDELNEVEVAAYLDLYQRTEEPAAREFARIHLNRCRGMMNIAHDLAAAFDRASLTPQLAYSLRAPFTDDQWSAFISPLVTLSLGSEARSERDVTTHLTPDSTFLPRIPQRNNQGGDDSSESSDGALGDDAEAPAEPEKRKWVTYRGYAYGARIATPSQRRCILQMKNTVDVRSYTALYWRWKLYRLSTPDHHLVNTRRGWRWVRNADEEEEDK